MKLINQLLDYTQRWTLPAVFLFTGNPVVKQNGAIVMGRGAAKQVRDFYPGIDIRFGNGIKEFPNHHLLWVSLHEDQHLGWFKVKNHWQSPAEISLIEESSRQLGDIATRYPDKTFHMNYPGVGNGRLHIDQVRGILTALPDNVLIYGGVPR